MHTTTMGSDSCETMNMYLHRRRPLLRVMAYTESSPEGMQPVKLFSENDEGLKRAAWEPARYNTKIRSG